MSAVFRAKSDEMPARVRNWPVVMAPPSRRTRIMK